jgi:hypothetical protein
LWTKSTLNLHPTVLIWIISLLPHIESLLTRLEIVLGHYHCDM